MLFGKIFYMIHRTISVRFLRDTIRQADSLVDSKSPKLLPSNQSFICDFVHECRPSLVNELDSCDHWLEVNSNRTYIPSSKC